MHLCGSLTEALELGENHVSCLRPLEWFAVLVVSVNVLVDGLSERMNTVVRSTLECVLGEQPEESFDEVQPGGVGRCEMKLEARMANEPASYYR